MKQGYITVRRLAVALGATSVATGCAISTQQEVQMGQQYSAEIAKQLPRVANARRMIASYDAARLRGVRKDDPAYQDFKRRVAALPLPPKK